MDYHDPKKKNGTIITKVVCAVCFLTFSFVWLYCFQADVLTIAQHVLSDGVTHYDRVLGAALITLVFFLLHLAVFAVTRLSRRTHALTYLPSMLGLAILSDIDVGVNQSSSLVHWLWLAPLILLLWCGAVWLARQVYPFEKEDKTPTGLFSQRVWLNLLQMALMMLFVPLAGNSNAVHHFRAHAEVALMKGDVDEVLRIGRKSQETDETLTMLRAYALARKGELGERLFEYPIVGKGENLLPSYSPLLILSPDTIWQFLGARPVIPMSAKSYYYCVEHDSLASSAVKDYVLCSYLIDKDLEGFATALPRYYDGIEREALPRYYREALDLYEQPRKNSESKISDFEHSQGTYYRYYYYSLDNHAIVW